MAYFCTPSSYANTFYDSPFSHRRPSPPPTTYYPRSNTYDPYVRALAEEQAARSALQNAIHREQEARRRRTQEEAKARIRAQEAARARARAARQGAGMFYGLPTGYQYPEYGYGYEDEDDEIEDTYSPFARFYSTPRRSPDFAFSPMSAPRMAHSHSRHPSQQESYDKDIEGQSSPQESESPKVSIPINTSSSPSSQYSDHLRNEAASKIQTTYRAHAARRSALTEIESIKQRFETQRSTFVFPSALDFQNDPASPEAPAVPEERPRLAYTTHNAPVHAHEDALVKMLQALDAIESHGDAAVRDARRTLVRAVEEELGRVDAAVRGAWEARVVQAKAASQRTSEEPMEVQPVMASEPDMAMEDAVDQTTSAAEPVLPTVESMDVEHTDIVEPVVEPVVEETGPGMEEPEPESLPPAEVMDVESTAITESAADDTAMNDVLIPPRVDNAPEPTTTHPDTSLAPPPTAADIVSGPILAAELVTDEPVLDSDSESGSEVETPSDSAVALPIAKVVSTENKDNDEEEEDEMVVVEESLKAPDVNERETAETVDTEFVLV